MKQKLLFLLLALLSLTTTAKAENLTVYDGTTENCYVPAYIYYFDDFSKSQFVIPADSLEDMKGGTISELTFYTTSANIPYTTRSSADVYLKEVEYTSISAFEDKSSATVVYTGYFSIVQAGNGGQMTITFDTPYVYQGGNLLIGIENTEDNDYKQIYFIGKGVTGASVAGANSSGLAAVGATQMNFIPKTTLAYSAVYVPQPKDFTCALTPGDGTVAALSWTEKGTATKWTLQYGTDPNFETYTEENVSGTPSISLTNLTAEQTYYARVKAVDGEDNESGWTAVISFTPTNAYIITVNDGTATNEIVPIYGYWCDSQTSSQYIIEAADLSAIAYGTIEKLTYYIDAESVNLGDAEFDVYMGEVDQTTFTDELVDWNALSKVYAGSVTIADNKMEITLDSPYQYEDGNLVIGFKQTESGNYTRTYWYGVAADSTAIGGYNSNLEIQDFRPKTTFNYTPGEPPTCFRPKNLALVAEPAYNSAQLQWTPGSTGQTVWDVAYKAVGDADFTIISEVSANPYTLTGLQPETRYYVMVRGNCGGGDVSTWTSPISFITPEQYPKPTDLMVDNITPNTADVRWKSSAPDFELLYTKGFFSPEGGYCYDDNVFETNFTASGEYSWGVMFPAGEYAGNRLSKVFLYDSEFMEATLTIFNDGDNEPSNQIASQTITFKGKEDYIEIDLNNLEIDETKNVWVVLTGTKAPAGGNVNYNPNGRWINVGDEWRDIADYDSDFAEYAFLIHALFEGDTPLDWTTVTDVASPHTLTGLDPETTYTVRLRAIYAGEGSESRWIGCTFQTPEANPIPFDVDVAVGCKSATISWSGFGEEYNVMYRKLTTVTPSENGLDEGFENGLDNWTVLRSEGAEGTDETDWKQQKPSSPHSGTYVARSKSWDNGSAYNVDNWLISPAVELDGTLSYWVYDDGYYHDHYDVYVSTSGNNIEDFELLYEPGNATNRWVQHTVDLSNYAGMQGYIAFRHTDYNQNYLYIDDVQIGSAVKDSWKIYSTRKDSIQFLNILEPGTAYEFQIGSFKEGMATMWTLPYYFTTSTQKTPGDVNDDTRISVGDVTATVNLIKAGGYDEAADLDGDDDVDSDDLDELVNNKLLIEEEEQEIPDVPIVQAKKRAAPKAARKTSLKLVKHPLEKGEKDVIQISKTKDIAKPRK